MKHILKQATTTQKQKWFLSAFLFAALGSNYYYQVTSLNAGSFEMALEAAPKKAVKKDITVVEASAPKASCTECETIEITKAEYKNLKALAEKVSVQEAEKTKKESIKEPETYQEKRDRLKEEKAEKEKIKKDKENEAKLIRTDEFEGKMEDAASNCNGNVECTTGKMINLLERSTGKNKIDPSSVTKAFNQYIAKDLRAALRNPESAEIILQSLQQLSTDIPSDYRFLKEKTVDILKNEALLKGLEINRNFKMADELTKAKKPIEASQYLSAALQQRDELTYSSNLMYQTTVQALQESKDLTTIDYIKRTYLPDINNLISNLANTNGLATSSATAATTLNQPSQATPSSTRSNTRLDISNSNTVDQKMTVNPQNLENNQNILNGVQFGNPTTRPRGNRGAVQ